MFPYDSKDHSRKRKFIEVGNTSADPFGLYSNADAFCARAPTTFKDNVNNLVDSSSSEDDDDVDYEDETEEKFDVFREKRKGLVVPLDPLIESDHVSLLL